MWGWVYFQHSQRIVWLKIDWSLHLCFSKAEDSTVICILIQNEQTLQDHSWCCLGVYLSGIPRYTTRKRCMTSISEYIQSVLLKYVEWQGLSFRYIRRVWVFDTPRGTEFFGGLRFGYTRGYWVQLRVWGPSFWGPSFRDTRSCNRKNASRPFRLNLHSCAYELDLKKEIHHLLWEMRG